MIWLDYEVLEGITVGSLLAFTVLVVAATILARLVSKLIRKEVDDRIGRRTSKSVPGCSSTTIVGSRSS